MEPINNPVKNYLPELKENCSVRAYDVHRCAEILISNPNARQCNLEEYLASTGRWNDSQIEKLAIAGRDLYDKAVSKMEKANLKNQPKVFYVKSIHHGRETIYSGTIEELTTNIFGYTLECGNSWNNKIPRYPKTIAKLVKALNDSAYECQRYSDFYEISSKEELEKKATVAA